MPFERSQLEVLSREECLRLLGKSQVGRVAVTMRALPVVLPVNYALLGDDVVFRTGEGTKLAAAVRNAVVAFEVDEVDPTGEHGWSVLIRGVAEEITCSEELEAARALPLPAWTPGEVARYVRVRSELLSGRRLPPARPD